MIPRLICWVFEHKHKKRGKDRIFISSVCMRCWRQSAKAKLDDQLYYFSGTTDSDGWDPQF